MALHHSPRIVTDGLILCLDAANVKSYIGSGTTFTDLSGRENHHEITAAPTYNTSPKSFTLNGSTQGFTRTSALTGVSSTCTVVIFYKTTDVAELWVMGNTTSYYLSASNNNNYYHGSCGTSILNYIDLVDRTGGNPYALGYKDGEYHMWEAKNVDFSAWTTFEWFLYPDPWQLAGDVALILVYNRVLTTAESTQNFKALKGRFNI